MYAPVDNARTKELGWSPKKSLADYIRSITESSANAARREQRILVFSTTFYPDHGVAEEALMDLMRAMPSVHFDVITTRFSKRGDTTRYPERNVTVYRIGFGTVRDKYLLPFLGAQKARELSAVHDYLFSWALFASYGAAAALLARRGKKRALLITIADQRVSSIPFHIRLVMRLILGKADQVYADDTHGTRALLALSQRASLVRSMGEGDAFANQVRFVYSNFLRERMKKASITPR
jgi:hypothetical protein